MNYFDDVADFHAKMGLPVSAESTHPAYPGIRPPGILSPKEFEYRWMFLHEELLELVKGFEKGDLAGFGDALVDIVYVVLGTAHYAGIPFNALWQEVQRANMEKRPWKEGDPIKPRNTTGLEVVKPEGWKPPDISGILRQFRQAYGFKQPGDDFVLDEDAFGNGSPI